MSILWCGGEEIDFLGSAAVANTSVGAFRSTYSRCCLTIGSGEWLYSPAVSPVSSLWVSVQVYTGNTFWSTVVEARAIGIAKSGTNAWIGIGSGSDYGKIAIRKYDGTTDTALAEESGVSFNTNTVYKVDIQVINYGPSGTVNVYVNGSLAVTYTGDIAVLSQTTLDRIYFFGILNGAYGYRISEVIIADEDTRLMSLKTLAPSASGDASAWTNGYANIDEVTLSDADVIYSSTADQEFQCNLTGMPTGDFTVRAAKVAARITEGTGGQSAQIGIRTNSTTYLGSDLTLSSSWETHEALYATNPNTSTRFTSGEIDALQFAVKSVA